MLFIGDCGVGKTTMINCFINKVFQEHNMSVSIEYLTTEMVVNGVHVKLKIWDTV